MSVKVTAVTIRDLGCLQTYELQIGEGGVEIRGRNGSGKSTIGRAIEATLVGRGIARESIRIGADSAEVTVSCDANPGPSFTARQTIPRDGSPRLVVRNDEGDTRPWQSPREKLVRAFGSLLDPVRFLGTSNVERLRMLTEIVPAVLTTEDLFRWTGEHISPEDGRHALEVIDEIRRGFYDRRKEANKAVAAATAAHKAAADEAERLKALDRLPVGTVVPVPGQEDAPVRAAERVLEALEQRKRQAEEVATRAQGTRERIAKLRTEAQTMREQMGEPPSEDSLKSIEETIGLCDADISELQRRIADLQAARSRAVALKDEWQRRSNERKEREEKIAAKEGLAEGYEATLDATSITAPTDEELAAANAAIVAAREHADLVRAARAAHDALVNAAALADEVTASTLEADRLDAIVRRLTTDAPAELMARAQAIPGLSVVDGAICLDGVAFDHLGGSEKLHFVVDLAMRSNPEGKLIKVDEISSLDDPTRAEFYEMVTAAGWDLVAMRPWADPGSDNTEPVAVPIRKAIEEIRQPKPRVTVVMSEGAGSEEPKP